MNKKPDKIYLQWHDDPNAEITWCEDRVAQDGDVDVEYIRAEAAEKRLEEERLIGMIWFDDFTYTGAKLEDAEKRVAELTARNDELEAWRIREVDKDLEKRVEEFEVLLADRNQDLGFEYDRANDAEKRVAELEEMFKTAETELHRWFTEEDWANLHLLKASKILGDALNK